MFTGITSRAGALVTAILVLTGAAILSGGAAVADPNQDDQFLALLDQEEIPAVKNVSSVIAAGHRVCRRLDAGTPVDDLVEAMRNDSYNVDPIVRRYPARVTSTVTRFIAAAVEVYCAYDQGKIASGMANPAPGSNEPTHRVAAYPHNAFGAGSDLWEQPPALNTSNMPAAWQEPTDTGALWLPHLVDGGVFGAGRYRDNRSDCDVHGTALATLIEAAPSGEINPPNPPEIPAPPPPTAQIRTPPRASAAPPPQQLPPAPEQPPPPEEPPPPPQEPPPPPQKVEPPQEPPPPPQQVEPPPAAPRPGGGADGGSGRSGRGHGRADNGGGDPAEPSTRMPPGFVRLAP
jgi:hypothetical protein